MFKCYFAADSRFGVTTLFYEKDLKTMYNWQFCPNGGNYRDFLQI